jgi:hypothetical protein
MLEHVGAGQKVRFRASEWNALLDVAKAFKTGRLDRFGSRPRAQTTAVLVRNDSASDLPAFAVLGVDQPLILPADDEAEFKSQVALSCVEPAAGTHEGRFAVIQEPLAVGAVGPAVIAGVTPVLLTVADEEAATNAEIIDEDLSQLAAASSGSATVLWREGGTGQQWALVRLGGVTEAGGATEIYWDDENTPDSGGPFSDAVHLRVVAGGFVHLYEDLETYPNSVILDLPPSEMFGALITGNLTGGWHQLSYNPATDDLCVLTPNDDIRFKGVTWTKPWDIFRQYDPTLGALWTGRGAGNNWDTLAPGNEGDMLVVALGEAAGLKYVPHVQGAPEDAAYLVLALDATLTNERCLVLGDGLDAVDGGAGGNYTLSVDLSELTHNDLGSAWPTTALGDLIVGTATAGVVSVLPIGEEGEAPVVTAGTLGYAGVMTNPMEAVDDIIVGGTGGLPTALSAPTIAGFLAFDPIGHIYWLQMSPGTIVYTDGDGYPQVLPCPPWPATLMHDTIVPYWLQMSPGTIVYTDGDGYPQVLPCPPWPATLMHDTIVPYWQQN